MLRSALVVEGSSPLQILQQPFHEALINVKPGVCGAAGCLWSAGLPCTVLRWKKKRRESKSSLCLLGALITGFCSQYVGEKELYL